MRHSSETSELCIHRSLERIRILVRVLQLDHGFDLAFNSALLGSALRALFGICCGIWKNVLLQYSHLVGDKLRIRTSSSFILHSYPFLHDQFRRQEPDITNK